MKRFFQVDNLVITLLIFVFMWLFTLIPFKLLFLDPVTKALGDFEINDIVFSKLREEQKIDTNIVLVNIGQLNRREIAAQLNTLNLYKPKVIGIDALFFEERDSLSDLQLAEAFSNCRDIVLANKLSGYREDGDYYDSLTLPHNIFNGLVSTGYANLPTGNISGSKTIRNFRPRTNFKNVKVNALAVEIARLFNENAFNTLVERDKDFEIINFRGNFNKFFLLDSYDFQDSLIDLSFLKDKIIIMGFMGSTITQKALEDIYFTPLNEKYAGRSYPDMYGVVIHANIISMILNKSYMSVMPLWLNLLLAFILCYINVYFVKTIYENVTDYFGGIVKIAIFLQSILFLFLTVQIFHMFSYKFSLTVALVGLILTQSSVVLYERLFKKLARSYYFKVKGN